MTLSMPLTALTLLHVLLSIIELGSGVGVLIDLLRRQPHERWLALFLASAAATNVTGFLLPARKFMPSHAVGVVSLLVLTLAAVSSYGAEYTGRWRATFVVSVIAALYLDSFVAVARAFQKVPWLRVVAPSGSGGVFVIAQGAVLLLFVVIAFQAVRRFHPPISTASRRGIA